MSPALAPTRPKKSATTAAPALPQVNLLPPEVAAARGLRVVKRWLVISLVIVVAVVGGVYVLALLGQREAEAELAQEQAYTERLLAEQAKYAEVPVVLGALTNSRDARWYAGSTDVLWQPYLRALAATAPEGVSFDTVSFSGLEPGQEVLPATVPFTDPSAGAITFAARSLSVPDVAAWLDALEAVPGFTDPVFSAVSITEVEGTVFYMVGATVQLDPSAWSHRFAPVTEEAATEGGEG